MLYLLQTGDKFEGFHGASLTLLVAAVTATTCWLLLFAWRSWASHPRLPDAGPETNDLGPEPPAISNLLVNRWKVTRAAMAATLVDLAARRFLGLDLVGHDGTVVRLRDAAGDGEKLTPCEEQVLELVRSRATGGSAPVEALDLGDPRMAGGWWKRFEKAVMRDARDRGLARSRWSKSDWTLLGAALAVVLALFALAFGAAHLGDGASTSRETIDRWDWLAIAAFAWLIGMTALGRLHDLRDTPAGQAACARWLGVRGYLQHSHALDEVPPAGVVVWERYLSHGVALGVAHQAAQALPFAAESPDSAWSRYGGSWHEVRVDYPAWFGYGQSPLKVFAEGLLRTAFWGGIGLFVLPFIVRTAWDVLDEALKNRNDQVGLGLLLGFAAVFSVAGVYVVVGTLKGLVRLWRGAADLGKSVTVEGEVVKVHEGRFAIDDGHRPETPALFPPVANAPWLARGMTVRATMSPRLHHVTRVEVLSSPEAMPVPANAPAMATPPA